MHTKKRRGVGGYVIVVLVVLVLAIYVWKKRTTFKQEQYLAAVVQQYARDRQLQGAGDNVTHKLVLPQDASPEIRCVINILQGDTQCPDDVYSSNKYDKGALAMLQGMTIWTSAKSTGELLSGYYALSTATKDFADAYASSTPLAHIRPRLFGAEKTNMNVSQAARYGIAVDFLVTYGDYLQRQAKELLETLQVLLVHVRAITTRLGMMKATTRDAEVCIETLQKAMTISQRTTADLKKFVEQVVENRVKKYVRDCLVDPDVCVQNQEKTLGEVASGFAVLQEGSKQYVIMYNDLINGLIQDPQKTLEELCAGKAEVDSAQARQQIEQGVEALNSQKQQKSSESGEQQSGYIQSGSTVPDQQGAPRGINHTPLNDYQKRYLKDIYDRQNEYLQERRELQKDPGFSPKSLLRQLFEEFYGNEDEFE